jgi:hypothetical protein
MYRTSILAAIALTSLAATGCYIYEHDDDDDGYSYCDDTGCYWCDDWGCYPDGGPGGEGWTCDTNYDCAAGCYCDDDGTCQEAGFCSYDSDCPEGFECDDRSSCVPEDSTPDTCDEDSDCDAGSFCDESTGQCVPSEECTEDGQCGPGYDCDEERGTCIPSTCDEDADCPEGSYCDEDSGQCVGSTVCGEDGSCPEGTECDEDRNTCEPVEPDQATCQGEVLCDEAPPTCPEGTNPGIVNGCYNGECIADADCPDGAPIYCSDHNEAACLADDTCETIYRGLNCTDPNGLPCTEEEANCECESFVFYECADAA